MPNATIYIGNVLDRLSEIADGSVQTCVTSPPYWGLRDYGTAEWEGGDPNCSHKVGRATRGGLTEFQQNNKGSFGDEAVWVCPHCGAQRIDEQLGLELTPEDYVASMVKVFREVWRVLADDGTLWLNIGDSYAHNVREHKSKSGVQNGNRGTKVMETPDRDFSKSGIKTKDLVGIPWRLAFALQADGWYLRQDIIWAKPNPMPESVTDRCTKSHEYVFLLSKSPRYYFDSQAIREKGAMVAGDSAGSPQRNTKETHGLGGGNTGMTAAKEKLARELTEKGYSTRNKRDVWTITTKPYKSAHFAVMPEALVEPCVLAGSKEGDTVLDPFTGSGTVAVVALRYGRDFVGTELNPEYAEIAENRISNASPLLNSVVVK